MNKIVVNSMNELVQSTLIQDGVIVYRTLNDRMVFNARDMWNLINSKISFTNWIANIINNGYTFLEEGRDYVKVITKTKGRDKIDYVVGIGNSNIFKNAVQDIPPKVKKAVKDSVDVQPVVKGVIEPKEFIIINNNGELVVSSRQVAEDFEKNHNHILRDIENIIGGLSTFGHTSNMFIETEYQHEQNKQVYKEYLLTRDGFTLLAMGFNGTKALQWKLKYIEAFNKMEKALKEITEEPQYKLPANFKEALQMLIVSEEEKEVLMLEGKAKDAKIEVLEPKAEYHDVVLVPENVVTVATMAKDFGMSAIKLNAILHKLGIQYRQGVKWLLYAKYDNKGYVDFYTGQNKDTGKVFTHMRWTQEGRKFIYRLLKKNGYIN